MQRERYKGNVGTVEPLITATVQRPGEIAAEQRLLACILAKNATFWDGAQRLRDEHFLDPYSSQIFRHMSRLIQAGKRANTITLAQFFMAPGSLEEVGGWAKYCSELISVHFNSLLDVPGCVETIIEMWKRRQAVDIHSEGFHNALGADPEVSANEQIMHSLEALNELAATDADGVKGASAGVSLQEALDDSEAIVRGEVSAGLSFGMPQLEELIGLLQSSCLYLLGGRPGMGKSALAKQIVIGAGRTLRQELADAPLSSPPPGVVLFFTLEMRRKQVSAWMGSEMAGVSNDALRGRPKTDAEAVALIAATAELKTLPIELIDGDGSPMTIQEVVARTRAIDAKREQGPVRLVVVDHVQKLFKAEKDVRNETMTTGKITSALKDLARSLGRPVIGLAHLTKEAGRREDGPPQLEDLRHAGDEDADVVFFLHRPEVGMSASPPEAQPGDSDKMIAQKRDQWRKRKDKWKNRAQLVVRKRREGDGPTEIIMGWRGPTTSFYEVGTPVASNIGPEDADGLPF